MSCAMNRNQTKDPPVLDKMPLPLSKRCSRPLIIVLLMKNLTLDISFLEKSSLTNVSTYSQQALIKISYCLIGWQSWHIQFSIWSFMFIIVLHKKWHILSHYSLTCVQQPPKGNSKTDRCKQVAVCCSQIRFWRCFVICIPPPIHHQHNYLH